MNERDTTVAAIVQAQTPAKGAAADAVVVTNENFPAYVEKQLGGTAVEEVVADSPEAKAAAEHAKIEADKAAKKAKEAQDNEEIDHPDKTKKERLNGRFSELTKARKDAEALASTRGKEAQEAQARADAAERAAAELRAKYEPPKSDDIGPEPDPKHFTDAVEYGKALKDWTADKTRIDLRREGEAKEQADRRAASAKNWTERTENFQKANPEMVEKHKETMVPISDQMHAEMMDSEVGPEMFYYLAENPEKAKEIRGMTVGKMLIEFGRLEAQIKGGKPKEALKLVLPKAEISQAPAPIVPLGTGGAPVVRLTGANDVPKNWTYEDYKKARQAGQIK